MKKQSNQCLLPYQPIEDDWRKQQSSVSAMLAPVCPDSEYLVIHTYLHFMTTLAGSVGFKKQWYRFYGAAGAQILTSPSELSGPSDVCAHDRAGWLSGDHPTLGEEPVTRKICFANRSEQDCAFSVEVQVVACQEEDGNMFYLYELPPTLQCSMVYCAQ